MYYKAITVSKPIAFELNQENKIETEPDTLAKPEIYVPPENMVLPADTSSLTKNIKKEEIASLDKQKNETDKKSKQDKPAKEQNPNKTEKLSATSKEIKLISYIPGTMGGSGKLPPHNCKTKGQLVMFYKIDKAGNVISTGRSSGIKDGCNITAAVIWMKKYVKAKKSQNNLEGTYTINFN